MLSFYILFNVIAGAVGLTVSFGEVIGFELRFNVTAGAIRAHDYHNLPQPAQLTHSGRLSTTLPHWESISHPSYGCRLWNHYYAYCHGE
jgi:hypothetical protein